MATQHEMSHDTSTDASGDNGARRTGLVGFHGRGAELAALQVLGGQLAEGSGGAVRVVGAAGIGKSRLVTQFAENSGFTFLYGVAREAERGRPFAALLEALGIDLGSLQPTGEDLAVTGDEVWIGVERCLDEIERRTATEPILLVLDDLQWADRGTWITVAALARRAKAIGLGLICIHRPLDARLPTPVPLTSCGGVIELDRLSEDETQSLVTEVLGRQPTEDEIASIHSAGGNPFFAIEIGLWLRDGAPADSTQPAQGVPDTLADTILRRIGSLHPDVLDVLRAVAILGDDATVMDAAALTSVELGSVARAIRGAAQAGIVIEDGTGIGFCHGLVRDVIKSTTPPATVTAYVAAKAASSVPSPWAASQLAAVAEPGDHRAAATILNAARTPGIGPETAAELFSAALRLGLPDTTDQLQVEVELLEALARSGELDLAAKRANELLPRLATVARDDSNAVRLRRFAARIDFAQGRIDEALETVRPAANLDDDLGMRCAADLALMEVLSVRGIDAVKTARTIREITTDPTARCSAELAVAVSTMRAGSLAESVEAATIAVAQTALEPSLTTEIHPEIFLADSLFYAERFDEAFAALDHARHAAQRSGVVWPIPHHLALTTGDGLRTGDYESAIAAAVEAVEWSIDTNQRIGATWPNVFLAVIAVHQGDQDTAVNALARAEADLAAGQWQGIEGIPWAAALVHEMQGRPGEGAQRLGQIVELAATVGWDLRVPLLAPDLARMAWREADHDLAQRMVELTDAARIELRTVEADAATRRCSGFANDDADALINAAKLYTSIGSLTQAGSSWAEAAMVAARTSGHDRAVQLLDTNAAPLLDEIGAAGVMQRTLDALPVRARRRVGRRSTRPRFGIEALTPAERRVCSLVSQGAANTEIAEQLSVSRRTVESHLSSCYRKLEVTSRIRLAALGITDDSP